MTISRILAAVLLAGTFAFPPGVRSAGAGERIVVLTSLPGAPFEEALSGFQEYLRKQGVQAEYDVYPLEGDASKAAQAVQKTKKSGCRLIYALGSLATDTATGEIKDIPIVAGLILRTDTLEKAPNVTGVGLEFPWEVQFKWLQRFLSGARTVGVIYNPQENQKRVEAALRAANKAGLQLEAQQVLSLQDVPAALENLSKSADVVLGIADNIALSPQIAKHIRLFSFRNSIPFVGLSRTWVKAGALYSLDCDYADLGAQCGEMAAKILKGAPAGEIPPAAPRKVLYTMNLKTARQMKLKISDDLVRGAQSTF